MERTPGAGSWQDPHADCARIVAQHDLPGADGFRRDANIGLQANSQIWCGAADSCAADDFVATTQGNSRAGRSGKMLRTLSNGANGRLQIEVGGMKLGFFRRRNGSKPDAGCAEFATRSWLRRNADGIREL